MLCYNVLSVMSWPSKHNVLVIYRFKNELYNFLVTLELWLQNYRRALWWRLPLSQISLPLLSPLLPWPSLGSPHYHSGCISDVGTSCLKNSTRSRVIVLLLEWDGSLSGCYAWRPSSIWFLCTPLSRPDLAAAVHAAPINLPLAISFLYVILLRCIGRQELVLGGETVYLNHA